MKVAMTEDALWMVLLFLSSNGERKIETDTYPQASDDMWVYIMLRLLLYIDHRLRKVNEEKHQLYWPMLFSWSEQILIDKEH